MARVRHPRTGEVRNLTGQEFQAAVSAGWEPVDNSPAAYVDLDGNERVRMVSPEEAAELYRRDNNGFVRAVDGRTGAQIAQANVERQRAANLDADNLTAGALGVASYGSFGASDAIIRSQGLQDEARASEEANPFVYHGAGLTTALAQMIGTGGAGAGTARVGSALSRMGLNGRAASLAARGLTIAGEEAAISAGFTIRDTIRENRPLSAEQLLGDAGLSIALGLGFEGATAGIGRIARRAMSAAEDGRGSLVAAARAVEAPPASPVDDLVSRAMRGDASDAEMEQINAALRSTELPRADNVLVDAASIGSGASRGDIGVVATREGRALINDAPEAIPRIARSLADDLSQIDEVVENVTVGRRGESWVDNFVADFTSVAPDAARARISEDLAALAQDARNIIARGGRAEFSARGARAVREIESSAQDAFDLVQNQATSEEMYRQLLRLKQKTDVIKRDMSVFDPTAGNLTPQDKAVLRDLVQRAGATMRDGSIWGERVATAARTHDEVWANHLARREGIGRILDALDPEGAGRAPSQARVAAALKKVGTGNADDLQGALEHFAIELYDDQRRLAEAMGGEIDPGLRALSQRFTANVVEGSRYSKALAAANRGQLAENRSFLAGGGGTATGAIVGGALGSILGPVGTAVGGFVGGVGFAALAHPMNFGMRLGRLESKINEFRRRTDDGLGAVRKSIKRGALRRGGSRMDARSGVRRAVPLLFADLRAEETEEEFQAVRADFLDLANDPNLLMDRMAASAASIEDIDLELADEFQMGMLRGVDYLSDHLPKPVQDPLFPDRDLAPPSRSEMDAFLERYHALEDPLSILHGVAEGTLSLEAANAVRSVYPALYGNLVAGIAGVLAEFKPDEISYQTRVHLGTLLGMDTDPSLQPGFLAILQNQGAQTPEQDRAINSPTNRVPVSARRPELANSTLTVSQKLDSNR